MNLDQESIFHSWDQEAKVVPPGKPLSKPPEKESEFTIWPQGLQEGMRFDTLEKARHYIEYRLKADGMPAELIGRQNHQGSTLKMGCTLCQAYILFRSFHSRTILYKFYNKHNHHVNSRKQRHIDELEQEVFKYLRESSDSQVRRSAMQVFSLSESEYERFRQNFNMQELQDYQFLQKFLLNNGYAFLVDWDQVRGDYPRSIVAVTNSMRHNYHRYKDLLRFDVLDAVLKNCSDTSKRYCLGVFSVINCCNQIVLAGVAVYYEETGDSFAKLFEKFMELQKGPPPVAILTDCSMPLLKAVDSFSQRFSSKITHIYDPQRIIDKIRNSLSAMRKPVASAILDKMAKFIGRLVETKSDTDYNNLMQELTGLQLPKNVIQDIVGCAHKIFYMQMPHQFIGLSRYPLTTNSQELSSALQGETTILELFRRITQMDRKQSRTSSFFRVFKEPIEKVMHDSRIAAVRIGVDRKLFQLFMENYVKALPMLAQRQIDHVNDTLEFEVRESFDDMVGVRVSNWQCTCSEYLRTNVPCSHMLACAQNTPDKPYLELFPRRWRMRTAAHQSVDIIE